MASKFSRVTGSGDTPQPQEQQQKKPTIEHGTPFKVFAKLEKEDLKDLTKLTLSEIEALCSKHPGEPLSGEEREYIRSRVSASLNQDTPHKERKKLEEIRSLLQTEILKKAEKNPGHPQKWAVQANLEALDILLGAEEKNIAEALFYLYNATFPPTEPHAIRVGKLDPLATLENMTKICDEYALQRSAGKFSLKTGLATSRKFAGLIGDRESKSKDEKKETQAKVYAKILNHSLETVENFLLEKDDDPQRKDAILTRHARIQIEEIHAGLTLDDKGRLDTSFHAGLETGEQHEERLTAIRKNLLVRFFSAHEISPYTLDSIFANQHILQQVRAGNKEGTLTMAEALAASPLELTMVDALSFDWRAKHLAEEVGGLEDTYHHLMSDANPNLLAIKKLNEQISALIESTSAGKAPQKKPFGTRTRKQEGASDDTEKKTPKKTRQPKETARKYFSSIESGLRTLHSKIENLGKQPQQADEPKEANPKFKKVTGKKE